MSPDEGCGVWGDPATGAPDRRSFPIAVTPSEGYRTLLTWQMTSVLPRSQELASGRPVWLLLYGCWLYLAMSPLKCQAQNGHSPISCVTLQEKRVTRSGEQLSPDLVSDILAGTQHLPIKRASGTRGLCSYLCTWNPLSLFVLGFLTSLMEVEAVLHQ